jgi:hypothetical protein
MKISSEWWSKATEELPVEKGGFDVDDTLNGILEKSAIPDVLTRFREVLSRVVSDEIIRKTILNNAEFGLCMVSDDVRRAVGKVLFVMKNPQLEKDLERALPGSQDPLRRVQSMRQGVDAAAERIAGQTNVSKDLNVNSLQVDPKVIDAILGDDDEDPVRPASKAHKLPSKPLLGDTRSVNAADFKAFLESQEKKKADGNQ